MMGRMGHVRDRWMVRNPETGRKVRGPRWGKGLRWQARVQRPDGTVRAKAFAFEAEAKRWLAVSETSPQLTAPRVTVAAVADQWLSGQLHYRDSTRRSTELRVESMLKPALGGVLLEDLTRARLQKVVSDWAATHAPSTVRVAWSHLTSILRQARLDGLLAGNPAEGVRLPPKPGERIRPLSDEQVTALLEAVSAPLRGMVLLGAASGLRPSELAGLTWDRVIGTRLRIDRQLTSTSPATPRWGPPKTRAGVRTVGVGQGVIEELQRHRLEHGEGPEGLLFVAPRGGVWTRGRLSETWRRYREVVGGGRGQGWHALRHYHASRLIAAGLSPVAVAARLGHADASETLATYSHLWATDEDRMEAAAEAIRGTLLGSSGPEQAPGEGSTVV